MGREVKRVPAGFDWPLNEVWEGFLSPFKFPACPDCTYDSPPTIMDTLFPTPRYGTGYTPEAYAVAQTFYAHMIGAADRAHADRLAWHDKLGQAEVDNLIAEGRLRECVKREPTEDNPRDWEWVSAPRTAAEVNAAQHGPGFSGHDGINRMILVRFRCERLGIKVQCGTCDGHGNIATAAEREAAENWKRTEPPMGEGWQLWETVSEGSPISPAFATAEELVAWMSDPERGKDWVPPAVAAKFVREG